MSVGHNAPNSTRSSDRNGEEAACPRATTPPSPRDLRTATERKQRVFGHNAPIQRDLRVTWARRHRVPSVTTPTLHRDPRVTTDGPRCSFRTPEVGLACPYGHNSPASRVRSVSIGSGPERLAEHDGPGSTCPPGKRGVRPRGLRSATSCNPRVHRRTVTAPPALRGSGVETPRVIGHPRPGNECPPDATGLGLRTLAGATNEVWSVHRAQRVATTAPWRVQRLVPRAPTGHSEPIAGLSIGHEGQHGPACSFGRDEPRPRTTFGLCGINDDRWVSGGLSPSGSELFGSDTDRSFGKASQLWENLRATTFLE